MHGICVLLPYSGNVLLIHGNISMVGYDSMGYFCSVEHRTNEKQKHVFWVKIGCGSLNHTATVFSSLSLL
jgi:hypothetical protein